MAKADGSCVASAGVKLEVIHESLLVLANRDAAQTRRQSAARRLIEQLRVLVRCWRYTNYQSNPFRVPDSMVDDAIQHVALVASIGNSRFRGRHPREALAWCTRILQNHWASEWRWRSRFPQTAVDLGADGQRIGLSTGQVTATQPVQEFRIALSRLRERAKSHLHSTRQPRAANSLFAAVCCYLDNVSGVPLARQLERWGSPLQVAQARDWARARNRIYQYHRRGRAILLELGATPYEARSSSMRQTDRPDIATPISFT